MTNGWIKIPRSILDQQFFKDSDAVHLYLYLHLKAAYKPMMDTFDGKPIELQKGQLITGRNQISRDLNMDENKVERILKRLQNAHKVNTRSGFRMRLISIIYEDDENQSEQQTNAKRTPNEQQTITFIKKENNNKKKNDDDDGTVTVDRKYYFDLFKRIEADEIKVELVMKNYFIDKHQFKHLLQQFFRSQEMVHKQWPNLNECLKHFRNWLTKQGDSVRAPIPEPVVDKTDIDDFYNSRMGPADRNPYQ